MITIFTDGASRGNPGPGGWGAVLRLENKVIELGGREDKTTNNRMELTAVARGLAYAQKNGGSAVRVYTDSKYVVEGITRWIKGWKANGWQTKAKTDVSNKDLWQELDLSCEGLSIEWKLLPGHSGIPGNEQADKIAIMYADEDNPGLYHGPISEYTLDLNNVDINTAEAHARKDKKNRSKAKAYSYLSLVGDELFRHKDWSSTEARVKGKKARFRKALSLQDERDIASSWGKNWEEIRDEK